jgi:uncharacterized protein with HEPN domain
MRIEAAKLLFDIASAARRVLEFTTGSNYENYSQSPLLRSAVERQFTVLGEAMSQLLRIEPELRAWIPECAAVIGFRNILIHGYAEGDPRIVWSIIQDKVPELLRRVNELLSTGV